MTFSTMIAHDQNEASTSTIIANIIARTPPNHASTVSCAVSMRCAIVITAAVIAPRNDAHIIALYASAVPMM